MQQAGETEFLPEPCNNEVFLFDQPRPIRTIHRSDGWTPEKLDAQLKAALAPSFTPLERSSDVFSWEKIPYAHELMRTNRHKPGNMAVLINTPRQGLRNFDDVLEAQRA